jgi:hypothetical protein
MSGLVIDGWTYTLPLNNMELVSQVVGWPLSASLDSSLEAGKFSCCKVNVELELTSTRINFYEIVTASGVIVTATPSASPDLYWALRGGGSNFGIVTNFKLNAFPLGKMWGGQRIYTENNFPAILDAIYSFATTKSSQDTDAAEIIVSIQPSLKRTQINHFSPFRIHLP